MTNGYKPAPLDLNHVKLTPNQNQLVEKLAENGHNVWARDRVRQGWTYSIVQVTINCSFFINPVLRCFVIFFLNNFIFCCIFFNNPRTSSISGTLVWCLTTCLTRELRKQTETVSTMLSVHSLAMATTLSLRIRRAVSPQLHNNRHLYSSYFYL